MKTYNVILYVSNMAASVAFYQSILGLPPVESSTNFSLFVLPGGMLLGLWAKADVVPAASVLSSGSELFWPQESKEAVDQCHGEWRRLGISISLAPQMMEFGYNFVALDPDGTRLRVCHLNPS